MKVATLGIITRGNKVLLGLKKGSPEIGAGVLNGPGGKLEPGETLIECLVRETQEEVGITLDPDPAKTKKVAVILFHAAGVPDFEVHVYRTNTFTGEPRETESMATGWYYIDRLPVNRMHDSDRRWFPLAIRGMKFCAKVYYRERGKDFLGIRFGTFVE